MQLLNLSQQLEKENSNFITDVEEDEDKASSSNENDSIIMNKLNDNKDTNTAAQANLSNSSFVCLNEKTFTNLIKSDLLSVTREMYVYYALSKWIEYNSKVNNKAFKPDVLYENLFKHIRLNALNREELEFILKNDRHMQANPSLLDKLKTYHSELMSVALVASNSPTELTKNNDTYSHNNTSPNMNDHKKAAAVNSNDANSQNSILLINNIFNKSRPSTIPREYFCVLYLDKFLCYDFYKSKWDDLKNLSPNCVFNMINSSSSTTSSNDSTTNCVFNSIEPLNGYSTCCINNQLYLMGGHSLSKNNNNIESTNLIGELVDHVLKFDPLKNEWSKCKSMPRKRAFHASLHFSSINISTKNEEDFIIVFYGICFDSDLNRFVQCLEIDAYNVNLDEWHTVALDSLLDHHIFYMFNNQFSRISNNSYSIELLLSFQPYQAKLITSVKSILYILNENCIRCYEFDSQIKTFNSLPYFQLPLNNLINYVISATTVITATTAGVGVGGSGANSISGSASGSEPSLNSMLFTWYTLSSPESDSSPASTPESTTTLPSSSNHEQEPEERCMFVKEALIYLLDAQNSLIYEFYPAKNKLKKLPNLLYKHCIDSTMNTFLMNIKRRVFVSGALLNTQDDSETGIETFDPETNAWSLFVSNMDNLLNSNTNDTSDNQKEEATTAAIATQNPAVPFLKNFFKLKMSLV
jgi:hypothetical protein